ncbi:hypothetical protein B5M42_020930 [Paenibacillus athensensis]|uniref:Uncharacterized protein n=1 Tax=Paenibacillus athensensis TaxID=1967502 RepID=A0A4Y8PYN2_9BACL|nr:hypothetical protein [Paenibacillus athensensis]MCD1261269.1 hypothetical protein [Paenibacillus athensensis]
MDNKSLLLALIGGSLILFLAAVIGFKTLARKNTGQGSMREYQRLLAPGKRDTLQSVYSRLQRLYAWLARIPLFQTYLANIRKRLSNLHTYDEWTLRKETMNIALSAWGALSLATLLLLLLSHDVLSLLAIVISMWVGHGIIVDVFVSRLENRLLWQLRNFLADVRHHFHQHGMVEEAIYDATEASPYEVGLHAQAVYDVLTASNSEERLEQYYETAPNRFLKGFAGISYLVREYGDKLTQNGSLYLKALSRLTTELNLEILRREKLSYLLQGLTAIALIPILFTKPIEHWALGHFPAMNDFYEGKLGFLTKIFLLAIIFGSYVLLRKMQELDGSKGVSQRKPWGQKLYEIPWLRWIVDRIVPAPATSEAIRSGKLLKETNSPLRLEWFFAQRILLGALCWLVSLGMFMTMHFIAIHHIETSAPNERLFGQLSSAEQAKAVEETALDRRIIAVVKGMSEQVNEAVIAELQKVPQLAQDEGRLTAAAHRIVQKLDAINGEYMKWWEAMLSLLIGWGGYDAPLGVLWFQKRMRQMEMKHEVDQFHSVIAMLSEMDRMSVEELLEWLERFAVIFKSPLQHCLLHYEQGAERALEQLKEDSPFPPFVRTIEKLQLAVEKIPIRQAFDDLETEYAFIQEQRKQEYERIIDTKAGWGRMIGFAPMYALIFLYLVFPLVYVSLNQMALYYEQLQKIQ